MRRDGDQTASVRIPGRPLEGAWQPSQIERAVLRFRGAKLDYSGQPPVLFSVYINLDRVEDASKENAGYAGEFGKEPTAKEDQIILFDVTRVLTAIARPGDRSSFTVFLETESAEFSWKSVELAIIQKETSA
jgi:hypothetical protein